jgi:hypothetical protein
MQTIKVLVALILAGWLAIPAWPGNGGLAYAQSQSGSEMSERERRAMEQKYQEQWDYLEKLNKHQNSTYERMEEAVKHRDDAEQRQKDAERRLREMEQQQK